MRRQNLVETKKKITNSSDFAIYCPWPWGNYANYVLIFSLKQYRILSNQQILDIGSNKSENEKFMNWLNYRGICLGEQIMRGMCKYELDLYLRLLFI